MNNQYASAASQGSNMVSAAEDPLTYCLATEMDSSFIHGGIAQRVAEPNSKHCQAYMSEFCAQDWNGFCEIASLNGETKVANTLEHCGGSNPTVRYDLTAGDILVRNTAARKYLQQMGNCQLEYQPFDPTVPQSPLISTWAGNNHALTDRCVPVYAVDPATIDKDPVMVKLLRKPEIGFDILVNIYNTMKRQGTLSKLRGTKLGEFYSESGFFIARGGLS